MYVTYHGGFETGSPYTHVGTQTNYVSYLDQWINPTLKSKININTYQLLVIVNPSFESSQEYIVDVLLDVMNNINIVEYLQDEIDFFQKELMLLENELKGGVTRKEKKLIKTEMKTLKEKIHHHSLTLTQYK